MFKFIKQYADNMHYAAIYPIVSLIIFFVFFIALLWFTFKADKKYIQEQANIPLD